MTLAVSSPATMLELAELVGARSRLMWVVAREMWKSGETFAVRAGGEPVLLCGLYPLGDGVAEGWFNARADAARHMLAIVRGIRLTLRASPYREIVTVIRTDAGRRIARAAGFVFFEHSQLGEVWSWKHCSAEAPRPRSSRPKRSSAASSPSSPASRPRSTRARPPVAVEAGGGCSPSCPAKARRPSARRRNAARKG